MKTAFFTIPPKVPINKSFYLRRSTTQVYGLTIVVVLLLLLLLL